MGTRTSGPPIPVLPMVLAGVGVAAGGFGGFAYNQANSRFYELRGTTDATRAQQLRDEGIGWRTATQLGAGVGVAAVFAAAATFFIGNAMAAGPAPEVAVSTSPRATGVVLSWRWP